jgi:trehalose-phosphatase
MLDYDGTLAPFRVNRDEAFPYPGIREILDDLLAADCCRVVLVSGRAVRDLIPLLGLKRPPEIWGSHGAEWRSQEGEYRVLPVPESAVDALNRAHTWAENEGLQDRCEHKPGCLALHWRGLSTQDVEGIRGKARRRWTHIAKEAQLELREFDGGLELRIPGREKGEAVRTILSEVKDDAVIAYLGDDETDEDAFRALAGRGLGVLVRTEWRETRAEIWLKPPEQLLMFLENWRRICVE